MREVSAAERASETSSAKQANEWAVQENEWTSEWPSTYIGILGGSGPLCNVGASWIGKVLLSCRNEVSVWISIESDLIGLWSWLGSISEFTGSSALHAGLSAISEPGGGFRRRLLSIDCLIVCLLIQFYFNNNCDHLLGDLNYTYRQLKKILPNEKLFKDMKNTLKSTCIDEDELVKSASISIN